MSKRFAVCEACHEWVEVALDDLGKQKQCPYCKFVGVVHWTNEDDNEYMIDMSIVMEDLGRAEVAP